MSDRAEVMLQCAELDHVGIVVPSLDQAIEFFTAALGFQLAFRTDPFDDPAGTSAARLGATSGRRFALAMLALGRGRLELIQWWPAPEANSPPADAVGAVHVAIQVGDVAAAVGHLSVIPGVDVIGEAVTFDPGQTPGLTNAFVTTPWGALVEILSWTDSRPEAP